MKNFKNILSEVSQPKSPEEKAFKDQHKIELIKHPVAPDSQFTGEIEGKSKKKRVADNDAGSDEKAYDQAYLEKGKTFKMPRNIDEAKGNKKQVVKGYNFGKMTINDIKKIARSIGRDPGDLNPWDLKLAEYVIRFCDKHGKKKLTDKIITELARRSGIHDMNYPDYYWAKTVAKAWSDGGVKDPLGLDEQQNEAIEEIELDERSLAKKESKKLSFKEMVQKIEGKEEIQEDAHEEIPMMQSQLNYIIYAAEEIMDYLDIVEDPEEWYQNKLSGVFHEMKSLHAYVEGEMRMMDMGSEDGMEDSYYGEETEPTEEEFEQIDERNKENKAKKDAFVSKIGQAEKGRMVKSYTDMPIGKNYGAAAHARNLKSVKGTHVKTYGRGEVQTDNVPRSKKYKGSYEFSNVGEEVELDEAIQAGSLKLNDGSTVKVSDKDSKLLNSLLSNLNVKNRKQMEKVMMANKKGFEEILEFAKASL